MTKLCQQYLSDVKTLLPIMGKTEKKYLIKLSQSLEDYCAEETVTTIEELYDGFGQPAEVVNTYITSMDTSYLIKRIRFAGWVKRGIIALLLISLVGVTIYGIKTYKAYKQFEREEIFFEEIKIID